MADFPDLGGFSLTGGDTPDIGSSIPSGGFSFGGGSIPSSIPGAGLSFGGGGLDASGIPAGGFDTSGISAPSGGGGWWDNLSGGLGKAIDPVLGFAKAAAPFAQLGTAGAGIANSIMGMQQGAQANKALGQSMRTQRDIAGAALPEATKLTTAGGEAMLGGPLPPGIEAQVNDWKQRTRAEMNSYLSHAGIANSTEQAKWDAWIEQQGYLMGQQLAGGLYGQGLQGLGVAGGGAAGLASTAGQMGSGVPQSIAGANKALSQLTAQG